MANQNCAADIRKLGSVRNFIQIPDARRCSRKTLFYGKNCQMMEVDAVQQDYRQNSQPIRTWNRYSEKYCTVGNTQQPPDNQTFTVRFYETCDQGVPLPHYLRNCRVRIINNHGLCKSQGDAAGGWSNYQEVIDGIVLSENRGKRTSYEGADDALVDELTLELINIFDVSGVYFSKLAPLGACTAATFKANDAVFDCSLGCGDTVCGCRQTCNDGTNTFYIPSSCTGNTANNYVNYTTDGGETFTQSILPATTIAGQSAAIYPKIAIANGKLYVLANQNPPTLYSIPLNEHGVPTGSWTTVANLGTTTGTPAQLIEDSGVLHILVEDSTGSRFYTYGDGYDPADGARETFTAASAIRKMAICGDDFYAVGDNGVIYQSADEGVTWSSLTSPTTENLYDVEVVGVNVWIAGSNGVLYRTTDDGVNWSQLKLLSTGNNTDITFSGDNIGWLSNSLNSAPYSTVLGGEDVNDWINTAPRLANWPTGITADHVVMPSCADGPQGVNTVLVFGKDTLGADVVYIGRGRVAGG